VVLGDFNTLPSPTDHPNKKINKEIKELNQMDLTDVSKYLIQ
jgi:hypothetical protein